VEWKVSGDSAEGKIPGEPQVIHLTHKDGKWCVHAGDILMGGAGDYERFASTWSRTAALLRETKARVGQPGVTPEALDKELGREIMMILLGVAGPQP
jgi:hypothetical protein